MLAAAEAPNENPPGPIDAPNAAGFTAVDVLPFVGAADGLAAAEAPNENPLGPIDAPNAAGSTAVDVLPFVLVRSPEVGSISPQDTHFVLSFSFQTPQASHRVLPSYRWANLFPQPSVIVTSADSPWDNLVTLATCFVGDPSSSSSLS